MKMGSIAWAALLMIAVTTEGVAATITYSGQQTQEDLTANYTVVTDGKIGALAASDITAFSFTISNPSTSVTRNQTNATLTFFGSGLIATTGTLSFNFGSTDLRVFQLSSGVNNFYRVAFSSYMGAIPPAINLRIGNDSVTTYPGVGSLVIATAQATPVPEPASWAEMSIALGLVGFMGLRRTRRQHGDQ